MTSFHVMPLRDGSYFAGACVLYPDARLSRVFLEVANRSTLLGRMTYTLSRYTSDQEVCYAALRKFLEDGYDAILIAYGGIHDGGSLD